MKTISDYIEEGYPSDVAEALVGRGKVVRAAIDAVREEARAGVDIAHSFELFFQRLGIPLAHAKGGSS